MLKLINRKTVFDRVSNVNTLPSPPQILIRFLETCGRNKYTSADLYDLVARDPALSTKLITLGAPLKVTEMGGRDVPALLQSLDPELIRYVAVNASVQQTFEQDRQGFYRKLIPFWRHSLKCALLARGLAHYSAYESVDEAYFAGLLHDIGKLTLYTKFPDIYEERTFLPHPPQQMGDREFEQHHFGATHDEIGSWLIRQAGLDSFFADAIHYHHDLLFRIRDAAPLVKILYSANRLCVGVGLEMDVNVENVARLFSLPISRIDALLAECNEELEDLARDLDMDGEGARLDQQGTGPHAGQGTERNRGGSTDAGIGLPAGSPAEPDTLSLTAQNKMAYLTYEVRDFSLLYGTLHNLLMAPSQEDIFEKVQHSIQILFGVKQSLIFLYNPKKDRLEGPARKVKGKVTTTEGFHIHCRGGRTLLSRTLNENMIRDSFGYLAHNQGTIIEEQIIRLMGTEGAICVPLTTQEEKIGVLVLGILENQFQRLSGQLKLLTIFADHTAGCLYMEELKTRHRAQLQMERLATAEKIARNVVREVNNPLGVMRNYLHILSQKLDPQDSGQGDIDKITAEIRRVARVMDQLSAFCEQRPGLSPSETVDIAELITSVVNGIRRESPLPLGVDLRFDLDADLPPLSTTAESLSAALKHLVINAVEAVGSSGDIVIRARRIGPQGSRPIGERRRATGNLEVAVQDNGPGIPEAIRGRLFEPYTTNKGGEHGGMGLSIVQNLIKQLKGHIICETDSQTGTTFRIILSVR